jgi:GH24 family phage-related lysozyme (muramidase)
MKTSKTGLDLIKTFEGCRLKAYKCPADVWTIGYGHTGSDVKQGMVITQAEADRLLQQDLERFEKNVMKFNNKYHWTQNEFDALVSFAFNIGSIDQLTANGTRTKAQIAQAMLLYNKAGGKVLPGLTKRRQAERQLFLTPSQEVKEKVDVTQSKVKKLPIIVDGKRHEIDGVFVAGMNYFSVRQLAQLLGVTVSNQGSVPVLTKK